MVLRDAIDLGEQQAQVIRKDIKHVHLSVYPPDGRIRISAPKGMALDTIRVYAITKLDWIRQQQRKLLAQERETPREYLDKESHYVWGKRYLLRNVETGGSAKVELKHSTLEIHLRPGSDTDKRHDVLESWYREQIRKAVPTLLIRWEPQLGVRPNRVLIQRMKTKWGSCNPISGHIRLNTELARKPPVCLEYIVVHELVHLLEPTHNARIQTLMDDAMPHWRQIRSELNQLPVSHEDWDY